MKHCTILPLLIIFLLFRQQGNGQTINQKGDTVKIYKYKTGIPFNIYMHEWFFGYGMRNSYSYNPKRLNKQDSLVIHADRSYYYKVYGTRDKLLFEGGSGYMGTEMVGDVKYYYQSGQLKRIEYWDFRQKDTSCVGISIGFNDAPGPEGTWKYFRKNGTLKKQVDYIIKVYGCQPLSYSVIRQTKSFKKNSKTKSTRQKKIYSWTDKIKNGA